MDTVSWYETLEGKLAMCLAVLLIAVSVLMARNETRFNTNPSTGTGVPVSNQSFEPAPVSNLAELPPLKPYVAPPAPSQPEPQPAPTLPAHSIIVKPTKPRKPLQFNFRLL